MLKKTITYNDYNDNPVTEDFYFNLTKADVLELNIREDLDAIAKGGDPNKIMDSFGRILKASYGTRLHGGAKFVKTEEAWLEFRASEAYSELFVSFFTDATAGAEFINALMPADVRQDIANNTGLTPSEFARKRSEESLQGHNKPAAPTQPTFVPPPTDTPAVQVPPTQQTAPTEIQYTAPPVVEPEHQSPGYLQAPQQYQPVVPSTPAPGPTPEELAAWRAQQAETQQ